MSTAAIPLPFTGGPGIPTAPPGHPPRPRPPAAHPIYTANYPGLVAYMGREQRRAVLLPRLATPRRPGFRFPWQDVVTTAGRYRRRPRAKVR